MKTIKYDLKKQKKTKKRGEAGVFELTVYCIRCVWKGGRKFTQVYHLSLAFWAERTFAIK